MPKKIYTPEVLASIPHMVADGLKADEIAAVIGTTTDALRVRCPQAKISLKRPKEEPEEPEIEEEEPPVDVRSFGVRLSTIQIKVKVDNDTLALISMRAEQKGTTVDAITARVLAAVARDNLYDAVIDE